MAQFTVTHNHATQNTVTLNYVSLVELVTTASFPASALYLLEINGLASHQSGSSISWINAKPPIYTRFCQRLDCPPWPSASALLHLLGDNLHLNPLRAPRNIQRSQRQRLPQGYRRRILQHRLVQH